MSRALFALPVLFILYALYTFGNGTTPAKSLLGLRVVDARSGKKPGFGSMFVREIPGKIVSGLFFGIGFFWAIFDNNAQAWHDKMADTSVIKASKLPSGSVEASAQT